MKCRNCGKTIRKATTHVYIRKEPTQYTTTSTSRFIKHVYVGDALPRAAADLAHLTNERVVAVRYSSANAGTVSDFHTWDGKTYLPCFSYFCTNRCAGLFGKRCAERGIT